MFVIGIDPGSRAMGYAVLKYEDRRTSFVQAGSLDAPAAWPRIRRLVELGNMLGEVVEEVDRDEVVLVGVEAGFVWNGRKGDKARGSQQGAIVSGAARGIAIDRLGARFGWESIREYQPATVKLSTTGNGAASKTDVAAFVRLALGLKTTPEENAADACAVALTRMRDDALYKGG